SLPTGCFEAAASARQLHPLTFIPYAQLPTEGLDKSSIDIGFTPAKTVMHVDGRYTSPGSHHRSHQRYAIGATGHPQHAFPGIGVKKVLHHRLYLLCLRHTS
ncbi:MAG: hypothetical protein NZ703_11090, partial [Gemmataceae bacterium]|nr:hypothetical protein [Gemmataceae bacterium]